MKNLIQAASIFLLLANSACTDSDPPSLVLKEVTTINIENGAETIASVMIKGDLIQDIGDFDQLKKDPSTNVIDCKGKYLVPGFIDMHTHISEHDNSIPNLVKFLNHGITSIRDMGGITDTVARAKEWIDNGQIDGPNIYFSGVTLDGPQSSDPFHEKVYDTTNLKTLALDLHNRGIDFFKVHNYFPIDRLHELRAIGDSLGIQVTEDLHRAH